MSWKAAPAIIAAMQTPPSPHSPHLVDIREDDVGQRIDNFLITYLKGVPRSRIYRLLRKGEVRVNKGRIKADYKLARGDQIRVPPIRVADLPPPATPGDKLLELVRQSIVYEDTDLLAVNKPSGMAVHGGSGINLGLIEVLRHLFQNKRLELVHRIDRDTSGLVLVAKRRPVLAQIQDQFRAGSVDKRYHTLVAGSWPRHSRRVDVPLLKNQLAGGERIVRVNVEGKPSVTEFRILQRYAEATLLEAKLLTGRTHQIRVHTQHTGHPIVGDPKYGDAASNKSMKQYGLTRLFLHAAELRVEHPAGGMLQLSAPLPEELVAVLDKLASTKL